jgi:hypothetical protein
MTQPTDADDPRANEPQGEREQMQERMDGRNEAGKRSPYPKVISIGIYDYERYQNIEKTADEDWHDAMAMVMLAQTGRGHLCRNDDRFKSYPIALCSSCREPDYADVVDPTPKRPEPRKSIIDEQAAEIVSLRERLTKAEARATAAETAAAQNALIADSYAGAIKELGELKLEADTLRAQLMDASKSAGQWKSECEMYANAWARETNGVMRKPKTHLIDELVLVTRSIKEKADKWDALGERSAAATAPQEGKQ